MAETSASKDVKTFKFGKYTVFLENHFYWRQATWTKIKLQQRCFPVTEAAARRYSEKLSKIRRKEPVMESFLRN